MVRLQTGENFNWKPNPGLPNLWIQLIEGETMVNEQKLHKADGLGIEDMDKELRFDAFCPSKLLVLSLTD